MDRGGSGRFSELAEEAEVGEAPRPRGWGSRPAGMKGGCPSGVARRCGCGSEDPRGPLTALCCSSPQVESFRCRCRCCCWCCGSAGRRCLGRGRPGRGPPQCCPPCPDRGLRRTGGEAESWAGTPGSPLCRGPGCTQSRTSSIHLNAPEETTERQTFSTMQSPFLSDKI